MPSNTQIKAESLPDGSQPEMNFLESSFFTNNMSNRSFPSPTQVRALSEPTRATQPSPVIFEDLNLLVKFGPYVTTNEAQCLWAIRNILGDAVPVPEVYGWRVDGDEVFIYMELIRGDTLLSRWDSMNTEDKDIVCKDLSRIMTSLRSIGQISYQPFVGKLSIWALWKNHSWYWKFLRVAERSSSLRLCIGGLSTWWPFSKHQGLQRLVCQSGLVSLPRSSINTRSVEGVLARHRQYQVYARGSSSRQYNCLLNSSPCNCDCRLGAWWLVSWLVGVLQGGIHVFLWRRMANYVDSQIFGA